jgi:hypothetical protein
VALSTPGKRLVIRRRSRESRSIRRQHFRLSVRGLLESERFDHAGLSPAYSRIGQSALVAARRDSPRINADALDPLSYR